MLIDKNKNKVVTQAITEAAAIASRVEPGGNISPGMSEARQSCERGSSNSLSQSTVGFFPLKGNGYPTHVCEYCPLSSLVLSCCCPCARCVRLFYIDTTTFSSNFYLCKHYIWRYFLWLGWAIFNYFVSWANLFCHWSKIHSNNIASLLWCRFEIFQPSLLKMSQAGHLPTSSISRVLKMYNWLDKISQFLLSFLHIHVSHQQSKISFHISITGISPNLNLAAANGTSLTWSIVPFLTHATGLWGGGAAFTFSSFILILYSYYHSQKSYFSHLLLTLLWFYVQIIFCQHFHYFFYYFLHLVLPPFLFLLLQNGLLTDYDTWTYITW